LGPIAANCLSFYRKVEAWRQLNPQLIGLGSEVAINRWNFKGDPEVLLIFPYWAEVERNSIFDKKKTMNNLQLDSYLTAIIKILVSGLKWRGASHPRINGEKSVFCEENSHAIYHLLGQLGYKDFQFAKIEPFMVIEDSVETTIGTVFPTIRVPKIGRGPGWRGITTLEIEKISRLTSCSSTRKRLIEMVTSMDYLLSLKYLSKCASKLFIRTVINPKVWEVNPYQALAF